MGCGGSVDASWRKAAAALKSTAPMARTHCGRLPISPGLIAAFGGPEGVTIRSGERMVSHNGRSWRNTNEPKRLLVPHLIDAKPIDLNQNLWTKDGEFYASEWVELDLGEAGGHATISRYALRHGGDKAMYFLRNWKLLGRQHSHEPWTTIREHHNDMTIGRAYDTRQGGFGVFYFDVPQSGPFRFFKVEAFGLQYQGFYGLAICGIELYGSLSSPTAAAPAGRTLRGLKIESVAQTEVTLAWEQGSAQSFEVQWCKTWGAWQNFATVRRAKARVSGLDAGGAYSFRVRATGGEWSQGVSAQLSAPAPAHGATLRNSAAQPERDSQPEPGIDAALGGAFNTSGRSNLPPQAEPAPERSSGTEECPVCLDRGRDTAFIPCGHQTCAECAGRISSARSYRCPVCRGPSSGTLRVF